MESARTIRHWIKWSPKIHHWVKWSPNNLAQNKMIKNDLALNKRSRSPGRCQWVFASWSVLVYKLLASQLEIAVKCNRKLIKSTFMPDAKLKIEICLQVVPFRKYCHIWLNHKPKTRQTKSFRMWKRILPMPKGNTGLKQGMTAIFSS